MSVFLYKYISIYIYIHVHKYVYTYICQKNVSHIGQNRHRNIFIEAQWLQLCVVSVAGQWLQVFRGWADPAATQHDWLVVSIPLKNMKVSWDDDIPNIWKKHVPNHQSDDVTNENWNIVWI